MKKSKGFTLAELLIVVAIIAVLVAVSIPVFTTQLAKAELATDTANVRAAYAEAVTSALADGDTSISLTIKSPATKCTVAVASHVITVTHSTKTSLSNKISIDESVQCNFTS